MEVRNALLETFVFENLGANAQTRDQLCARNTPFVRVFLNNHDDKKAVVVADGTYLRIEKSSNNEVQKKAYSGQKKAPIVKPFIICAPDGYIIEIYGLYPGTMNDAQIIKAIMKNDQNLRKLLKEGDIFVLDRGFRDALDDLKNKYKLETMMPLLLDKSQNQKQFTAEEANQSRLCTKIRFVVEAAIGLIKARYRVFDHRAENKSLTHYLDDIRIAGALVNKYCKRLISDKDNALQMARSMFQKRKQENKLKELVEKHHLHRKSLFIEIQNNEIEFVNFPKLSVETMQNEITYGSYQLSHSLSYLAEHFNQNGSYLIFSCKQPITDDGSKIISTKIQSRHTSSKKFRVFIHYMPLLDTTTERPDFVKGWFCECKSGARTVGSCSHVAALLYFLAYARHINHQSLLKPACFLSSIFPDHINQIENKSEASEDSDEASNNLKSKQKKRPNKSAQEAYSSSENDKNDDEDKEDRDDEESESENFSGKKPIQSKQIEKKIRASQSVNFKTATLLNTFYSHLPAWGGIIKSSTDLCNNYNGFLITNTCSFDYILFGLWFSTKLSERVKNVLADNSSLRDFDRQALNTVIDFIEQNKWNEAKSIWILEILKMTPNAPHSFSTYNASYNSIGRIISEQQKYIAEAKCEFCSHEERDKQLMHFYFNTDINNNLIHTFSHGYECPLCEQTMNTRKGRFISTPAWLVFDINYKDHSTNVNCYDVPKLITVNEFTFKLLCCQIHTNEASKTSAHFKGIFLIEDIFYMVDDLNIKKRPNIPKKQKVSSCLYYLFE
jgi:hypothetical protein